MNEIEIGHEYGAKWGLTDFYDDVEPVIKEVVTSGKNFRFSYGCKKEIRYCTIQRDRGSIEVTVSCSIDELPDLTDTLVWDAAGKNDFSVGGYDAAGKILGLDTSDDTNEEVVYSFLEEVQDQLMDYGLYQETFTAYRDLGTTKSWRAVVEAISELEDVVDQESQDAYAAMLECVRTMIAEKKESKP